MSKKPALESLLDRIKDPSTVSIIKAMQQHITDASLEALARYIVRLEGKSDSLSTDEHNAKGDPDK